MSTLILTAMESPVEALAFDYLTFGILTVVNNLWTWVAVVTAAVSLWRFKVVAGSSADLIAPPPPTPTSLQPATPLLEDQTVVGSKAFACPSELTPPSENSAAVVVEDNRLGGARKGVKFALYYRHEVEEADEEEEEEAEAAAAEEEEVEVGAWWEMWEEALRTRRGEKGWYRYQDLTELNGNVVRLWEGRR